MKILVAALLLACASGCPGETAGPEQPPSASDQGQAPRPGSPGVPSKPATARPIPAGRTMDVAALAPAEEMPKGKMPEGLPLRMIADAQFTGGTKTKTTGGFAYFLTATSKKPPEEIERFYTKALASAGMKTEVGNFEEANRRVITIDGTKQDCDANIAIVRGQAPPAQITINWLPK